MPDGLIALACQALQRQGALFAYLHGSWATGEPGPQSDIDVAACFIPPAPAAFEVEVPAGIDLLVLNDAPLEIKGRIALHGLLILDADPVARVRWEANTRKIYFDELPRIARAHRDYLEAVRRG